jgi:Zn-dependent protease
MHDQPAEPRESKEARNLRIVARHLARGGATMPGASAQSASAAQAAGTRAAGVQTGAAPKARSGQAWKRWGPLGVALAFVAGKLKLLIPLLKFANLGTLVTMILALWVYAQIWGFAFALGFILLIFVHEMGHGLVMRQQGIPTGAPVFIPFVGAVIAMKEMPRNGYVEALVALGGPAVGTLGAIVCLAVGALTGSLFWYALASTGFLINLFNMIPISPLDGGRIVGVISRWLWAAGYAVGIAVFLVTKSPILFLILLLGLFGLGRTLKGPRPGYYDVPPAARRFISMAYFGLMAIMVLGMWTADRPLAAIHAIR